LDEPHAALDASARSELARLVAEAVADGVTVISASHEPDASMEIATRSVALAGGRVVTDVAGAKAATIGKERAPAGKEPAPVSGEPAHVGKVPGRVAGDQVVVAFRGGPNVA
jgi:energy-coupling factor transporter ATP-binding protein EcfA2